MNTATYVKKMKSWQSDAALYQLSIALDGYDYVIVSATNVFSGPETFIFGTDKNAKKINWLELTGSFCGEMNHSEALRRAGYCIAGGEGEQ